ncbi:uncharacterized protein EV422DRAFT_500154 [Fimicolochytrium jonesii]|uniref:uncharacterized protein n=1 Tax=Fimicolochytrium jonesii TaxID=1396493 RepID=UPI0022FF3157|nr:uncharacterized protein EV422DRAFT_500154 [Fimicolochytrium jonesii]KAI8817372.1 hypothetical protein EV422DRAFT_500154 [Fimicolochytrium jonesii]
MLSGFRRTPERFNPKFDGFAVSLKSGVDVVHERSLIQLMSFLQPIRNLMLIGDGVVEVGDLEMVDVVTDLYEKDEAKKLEKRNLAKPKAHKERKVSHKASDSVQVDESSQGWKSDSHKNLPGFRELWNRFPDADWYVMLDDDTYVFFDNLADRLSIYDPEHKHYFGAKTQFVGCDNIWQWGQGPYFAHGGSGIVLSRGALRELVEGVDVCIERYKTCWAGDVRTALCLRDQGILLHSPSGFHGSPPNKDFWFPHNPCDRPMTFHHLLVKQIQDLYNLERRMISQHGKGSVAFGDIYWDWHAGSELQTNYDRRGADVAQLPANTTQACQALCASKKICTTFVFDGKMCWMKDRIPPGSPEKGMTTGIVKSRYTCGGSSRGGFR